jgi:hypothetical protein
MMNKSLELLQLSTLVFLLTEIEFLLEREAFSLLTIINIHEK